MKNRKKDSTRPAAGHDTSTTARTARRRPGPEERRTAAPRSAVRARAKAQSTASAPPVAVPMPPQHSVFNAAAAYQSIYSSLCCASPEGLLVLDVQRFAEAVADMGIGVLAEQELYQLALLAAAEGNVSLPEDALAAVLSKASERESRSSAVSGAGLAA